MTLKNGSMTKILFANTNQRTDCFVFRRDLLIHFYEMKHEKELILLCSVAFKF